MKNIYKKLRWDRSQEEVAKKIGISQRTYSHYENGKREPDHKTLIAICDFFDVSIDYLLGRKK